ncbi:MAG: type II secretion system GspH family protein [Phycisphaerales bacterium]|nr:type II secretion system GspH family protein [Phycisphaerales bacterium]MCI0631041.1 type II secretion system GspH family protein [Phycisphaerales bacterium]MCI0675743.1 type II secretion system GspH family protein [Phycisphaerales bacterium]
MRTSSKRAQGFTIVEMLVVVAIIGLLVGLLMPTLNGVRKRNLKTSEINSLRQVGNAWQMYSNGNDDAALPGYLEVAVQAMPVSGVSQGWGVKYEYPIQTPAMASKAIPPAPTYGLSEPNIAGPWTWRLLPLLDHSHEMVHGYADESDESVFELVSEAEEVALQPSFGYNGYYLGGYWRMHNIGNMQIPKHDFYNHCDTTDNMGVSIPLTIPQISRSTETVTFCSSTQFDGSLPVYLYHKLPADTPGAHLVTGPFLGNTAQWTPHSGDRSFSVIVNTPNAYVPLGRYTGAMAVLWADGHTDTQSLSQLVDQRRWINGATSATYQHAQCP